MDGDLEKQAQQYSEHAKWLIGLHDARGESLCNRAVALLGFVGVSLALVSGSGLSTAINRNWLIDLASGVTVAALLAASACCLGTLNTRESKVPGARRARRNWLASVRGQRDTAAVDIAETYLTAKDLNQDSVVDWAKRSADARATWFKRAVYSIAVSLGSLTVLLATAGICSYL